MVLPVKIFEIRSLEGNPVESLTGWREVEQVEDDLSLVTEVLEMDPPGFSFSFTTFQISPETAPSSPISQRYRKASSSYSFKVFLSPV